MKNFGARLFMLAAVIGLILVGFVIGTAVISTQANTPAAQIAPIEQVPTQDPAALIANLSPLEQPLAELYNTVSPSVVSINVASQFGAGGGSGFVLDKSGNIATNYHVVAEAEEIIVNFLDGTIVRAEVVGLDPDSDLAVIRVDLPEEQLFPVTFGSSDNLVVGQMVVAIGSPFGQRWTMTSGIVSALERRIDGLNQGFSIGGVIQTDASINPGNSGGPLLNLRGEVVGVNSQIRSETGENSGIGFAIPSDLVVRVVNALIADGRVDYSYLGISGLDVGLAVIEELGLPNNTQGVLITGTERDGAADRAGLRPIRTTTGNDLVLEGADIIVAIEGRSIRGLSDLVAFLGRETAPGDTITITVLRDGERVDVPVTLDARPRRGSVVR